MMYTWRSMREARDELLLKKMKYGKVYRRGDLLEDSSAADRYLQKLVNKKKLMKVSAGLYVRPKESAFGMVPPNESALVQAFLKDDRFLIFSYSTYNQLGLGLTQLYNQKIVYNFKRHTKMKLGNVDYFFKRVPNFPKKISKEFLLIDLFNNLKNLNEDGEKLAENLKRVKDRFNSKEVLAASQSYGRKSTQRVMEEVFSE